MRDKQTQLREEVNSRSFDATMRVWDLPADRCLRVHDASSAYVRGVSPSMDWRTCLPRAQTVPFGSGNCIQAGARACWRLSTRSLDPRRAVHPVALV
jgi:hypothetical protein